MQEIITLKDIKLDLENLIEIELGRAYSEGRVNIEIYPNGKISFERASGGKKYFSMEGCYRPIISKKYRYDGGFYKPKVEFSWKLQLNGESRGVSYWYDLETKEKEWLTKIKTKTKPIHTLFFPSSSGCQEIDYGRNTFDKEKILTQQVAHWLMDHSKLLLPKEMYILDFSQNSRGGVFMTKIEKKLKERIFKNWFDYLSKIEP